MTNGNDGDGGNNPPGGSGNQGAENTAGDSDAADHKEIKNVENQQIVNRISVKPAPFNRNDPEIWIVQLETQFAPNIQSISM